MSFPRITAAAMAVVMTAAIVPIATANAAERETVVTANVSRPVAHVGYGDLQLGNAADVAELKARVRRAATRICIQDGVKDLVTQMDGNACRSEAIAGASQQIEFAIANSNGVQTAMRTVTVTAE